MRNNKGFTLMEMLIVVAIIAILITIAIPTFTTTLEKTREAKDLANIRTAMTEVYQAAIMEDTGVAAGITYHKDGYYQKVVQITQKKWGWQSENGVKQIKLNGANIQAKQGNDSDQKLNTGWYIRYYPNDGIFKVATKK